MANKNMSNKKGILEQIYTPPQLIQYMIKLLKENVDINQISEFLEPSAGDGGMIKELQKEFKGVPITAYEIDLDEEVKYINDTPIIKGDFFKQKINYKKGRITFMNPPFTAAKRFILKGLEVGDKVMFISPINTILNLPYDDIDFISTNHISKQEFSDGKKYSIIIGLWGRK